MTSSCFYLFLLASFFILYPTASSSPKTISYNDHCSSIVPQSKVTTTLTHLLSIPTLSAIDFTGGDRLLPANNTYANVRKSLNLRILYDHFQTEVEGIYQVQGIVNIRNPYAYEEGVRRNYTYGGSYHRRSRARGSIKFIMKGFWSEDSRKLCMVGSASYAGDSTGKITNFDAVLKLKYASDINPTIYTSIVSGTLESTNSQQNDARYFDPISLFSFPPNPNYNYSIVSKEIGQPISSDPDQSLKLEPNQFCSVIGWRYISMELKCREEHRPCSPLRSSGQALLLSPIEHCFEGNTKFRFMAKFQNFSYDDGSFNPESTLIGEAAWDDNKNVLLGVACRLLDPLAHFGDAVGDCTFKFTLRYPSTLTIVNNSKLVGQIWSSKAVNDSGFFKKIDLISNNENGMVPFPGPKYEYTKIDKVRNSCDKKAVKKKGSKYPDGLSSNMRFDMSIKNREGELAWAYAIPLFVGNDSYQINDVFLAMSPISSPSSVIEETFSEPVNKSPVNISYRISITPIPQQFNSSWNPVLNTSNSLDHWTEVTAEGVYRAETGDLCMVGCRKMVNNSIISRDCEVLVKVQFPPFDTRGGLIKGTIESTRAKTDSLHFDDLFIQSAAYYAEVAEASIWRMDLEITLILVSNTFACIFIGLQIFHVKRNPEVHSSISIVMLLILSVGHMIPLVLNFEAVFLGNHSKQNLQLSNGGKLEGNEVAVRVITMVAFLLQIRLLQLVWTSKDSGMKEKKAGVLSLGLYILGGGIAFLLNWIRNKYAHQGMYSLWGDLRSYAGLILDGFLLPQILLNVFVGSAEKALSHSFYMGTSAVRLVPHAYNQYRMHNYPKFDLNTTYYYANPAADFYSTAWDIIIPCGVIWLAVVVFFQQRHGGRCILPKRMRDLQMYEKVSVVES